MGRETIQVIYEPLGTFPGTGTPYFHETLVYTNSAGQEFISSCYGSGAGPGSFSGQLSGISAGASGSATSWGTLQCTTTSTTSQLAIDTWGTQGLANLLSPSNQTVTVSSGSNLSAQWGIITDVEKQITAANFEYSPVTLNSNSATGTALTAAGINPPASGLSSVVWAPGWQNILPTTYTKAQPDESTTTYTDAMGNTVYTITDKNASGQVTDSVQITPATQTVGVSDYNASGSLQYTETTTTSTAGAITAKISGQGAVDTLSNATINVAPNSSASVIGTGNAIVAGSGDTITLSNATITVAAGSTVTINGSGDTVNAGAGATVIVGGNGTSGTADTVNESSGTVTIESNSSVNVNGTSDSVSAGSADNLGVHGNQDIVNAVSGDAVWIGNGGASVTGDKINASGATVTIGTNVSVDVYGTSNTITAGSGDNLGAHGYSDVINAVAGDGVWVGNGGTVVGNDTVNATGATITFGANAITGIVNGKNTINLATGDIITANGGGSTINTGLSDTVTLENTNGNFDVVNGTGGGPNASDGAYSGVILASNAQANIYGSSQMVWENSSNTLNMYASGGTSSITLSGKDDLTKVFGANVATTAYQGDNGDRTDNYGTGDITHDYGNYDQTNNFGSSESTYQLGSYDVGYDTNTSDSDYVASGSNDYTSGAASTGYYITGGYTLPEDIAVPGITLSPKGGDISAIVQYEIRHGQQLIDNAPKGMARVHGEMVRSNFVATSIFDCAPVSVSTTYSADQLIQSIAAFGAPLSALQNDVIPENRHQFYAPLLAVGR